MNRMNATNRPAWPRQLMLAPLVDALLVVGAAMMAVAVWLPTAPPIVPGHAAAIAAAVEAETSVHVTLPPVSVTARRKQAEAAPSGEATAQGRNGCTTIALMDNEGVRRFQ